MIGQLRILCKLSTICEHCGKKYDNEKKLRSHFYNQHFDSLKSYVCDICNSKFKRKCELTRHMNKHTLPFSCNDCGKSFQRNNDLRDHMLSHVQVLICDVCKKTFTHQRQLKRHITLFHTNESKYFDCLKCHKRFKRSDNLLRHSKTCK